jgi:hypothetical protein
MFALLAAPVVLAGGMAVGAAAPAMASEWNHGVVDYGAIYPSNPDYASSFKVYTYDNVVSGGYRSFEAFRVSKTQGPCGIVGVSIFHTGLDRTDNWDHAWPNGVASTGIQDSAPGWGNRYFKSFNVVYTVDTICGKFRVVTQLR